MKTFKFQPSSVKVDSFTFSREELVDFAGEDAVETLEYQLAHPGVSEEDAEDALWEERFAQRDAFVNSLTDDEKAEYDKVMHSRFSVDG